MPNPFIDKEKIARTNTRPKPSTAEKKDRKPVTPNIDLVCAAIERGEYDDEIKRILNECNARISERQAKALELVHEVFGEQAAVVVGRQVTEDPMKAFVQARSRPVKNSEPTSIEPEENVITEDALAHLDGVEKVMAEEVSQTPPNPTVPMSQIPIEQRGAVISGLHSSQIGD